VFRLGLCASGAGTAEQSSAHNNFYLNNRVHDVHFFTDSCQSGEGIYLSGARDTIENNIIWRVHGVGINTGHDADQMVISNNTIFNAGTNTGSSFIGGGIQIAACTGKGDSEIPNSSTIVSNNIIYNNIGIAIWLSDCVGTNNLVSHNLIFGNGSNKVYCNTSSSLCSTVTTTGTVSANPQFVNYQPNGTGDYQLQAGSPAIGAGTTSFASGGLTPCTPSTDFNGNAYTNPPSIGAYK
jgi:hypothetical protein